MDPTYPLLPVFAFLGFTLCFVPLKWQFEAWNVGTLWYIFWAALSCINVYFNALVWVGNTVNSAPAWCEISIRITMAASVGISAAALAINRRLYEIASGPLDGVISKPQKQRALLIDSLLCGLFPALFVVCQLVIQRHRFDILEDVGCVPDLYDGLATYFLSSMWPILLGFGSVVYCTLAIRAFTASRATFSNNLAPHKHLTPTRFLRLAGLSFATTLYSFALGMLSIATIATASAAADLAPFSDIAQLPRAVWAARDSNELAVELTRWLGPVCALIFFAFFGLAVEARAGYMRGLTAISNAFWNMLARAGYTRPLPPLPGTFPSQAPPMRPTLRERFIALRLKASELEFELELPQWLRPKKPPAPPISFPVSALSPRLSYDVSRAPPAVPKPKAKAAPKPVASELEPTPTPLRTTYDPFAAATYVPPQHRPYDAAPQLPELPTPPAGFVLAWTSEEEPDKLIVSPYTGWHRQPTPTPSVGRPVLPPREDSFEMKQLPKAPRTLI